MQNQAITDSFNDPMGAAITDFHRTGKADKLRVFSSMFEEDEIPVEVLFRQYDEMPELEQTALQLAKGRILDVGAGAGCHSLALQNMQKDVTAIDISPLSVSVMKERGVKNAQLQDFFEDGYSEKFDTIIMLMNGTGIVGKLKNISAFFDKAKQLLSSDGQVLIDSTDLAYIFEDEDGFFDATEFENYYGEVDFQMQYKNIKGEPFDWLYLDFETLSQAAEAHGFQAELLKEGKNDNYLARLSPL